MIRALLFVTAVFAVGCNPSTTPDGKPNIREDRFEQGRLAGKAGLPRESNPYAAGTANWERIRRSEWFNGYNTGAAEKAIEDRERKSIEDRALRLLKIQP